MTDGGVEEIVAELQEALCDICGGPLGQQRWRGFPPICSRCEMESIHDTPGLSGPYLDAYNRLRDVRNMIADAFRTLEEEAEDISEGDPIWEVIVQIEDLTQTFRESMVLPVDDEDWTE